jgi:AcrR family transcriptional regulator
MTMGMTGNADNTKLSSRGRPRSGANRRVSDALLGAAQAGLHLKSFDELTSREIALSAGANSAMIKYYFDGKDGLFSTLIENALKKSAAALNALEKDIGHIEGSPTRALVALLVEHYYSNAPLYKVLMDELRNQNSVIRQRYMRRASRTFVQVTRIINKLIELGVYRPDTNVRHAAFTITCLISTPISMSPMIEQLGFTMDELEGEAWINSISGMLEREFGATTQCRR